MCRSVNTQIDDNFNQNKNPSKKIGLPFESSSSSFNHKILQTISKLDLKTNSSGYHGQSQKPLLNHILQIKGFNQSTNEIKTNKKRHKFKFRYCWCGKSSKRKKLKKLFNQNIIEDKENTIMVTEGENKVKKLVKVNGNKFKVMVFGRKSGSKMLHKIKLFMLKEKYQNLLHNRMNFSRLLKKIWKSYACFNGLKLKNPF